MNEVVVPGSFAAATTIAFLPDGRMLVGELTNTIWVVQPGSSAPDPVPFLVIDNPGLRAEQGLLDVLPDPNFAQNGHYYVYYTKTHGGFDNRNRLSRFTASGNATDPATEVVLWEDFWWAGTDHQGGSIALGIDGKLYVSIGDLTSTFQPQRLDHYGGKILRINLDGSIPTDNPFYDGAGPNKDEIWALGLRNPFRMSIDPVTGRMYLGDVGENSTTTSIEEINLVTRGANYGWPLCEGSCGVAGMTNPVFQYVHPNHDAAVIGGVVYRGNQFPPEYQGSYFYGDFTAGFIRRLTLNPDGTVASALSFWPANGSLDDPTVGDLVKFLVGPDGSLYFIDIGFTSHYEPNTAAIRRIRWTSGNLPPVCEASAAPTSGPPPLLVNFSSAGSFDPEGAPLTYLWNFGDGFTSTQPGPSHTYGSEGSYLARLTVSDGSSSTLSDDLAISVGAAPTATITSPPDGSTFRAGDVISFSGSGFDPTQGALAPSALSWTIGFRHEDHVHPGGSVNGSATGTLTIATSGHSFEGNTRYEITLTATDASGLTDTTSVTVFPEKRNATFQTQPPGLSVDIDGVRKQTPFVLDSLIGFQHTISAPQQTSGGTTWSFTGWSDGGAQTHGITTTTGTSQSYTASFQATATPGLVAAYSFDDGSGDVVVDDSGSGNAGTRGTASWTPNGRFTKGLVFDGSTSRVTIPDAPSLDLTTAMTLMAWVRPTLIRDYWTDLVYKGNDVYFLSAFTPGTRPAVGGSFTEPPLTGPSTLPLDQWSHLATTYDGATLRLFVNGAQVASRAQTGPIATSGFPLEIGGDGLHGQYFQGTIDEVRVFNRALTAGEVQTQMNKAIRPVTVSPTNGCGIGPELALALPCLLWLRRRARRGCPRQESNLRPKV